MSLFFYILNIFLILWTKAKETVRENFFDRLNGLLLDKAITVQYSTCGRYSHCSAGACERKEAGNPTSGESPMSGSASSEKVSPLLSRERKNSCAATARLSPRGRRQEGRFFSQDPYVCTPGHTPPHRVHTEWQWPISSGVHSIMMEKSALAGEGGGVHTYLLSRYLPSHTNFQCTLQLRGQIPQVGSYALSSLFCTG